MTRTWAFLGSGEFEPWHEPLDRWVAGRTAPGGHVVVVPTASAADGDDVFEGWAERGRRYYEGLGLPVRVAPIRRRPDADDASIVDLLDGASAVFFSGGNPFGLAEAMRGSAFWSRLVTGLDDGLGLIGCSAGVAFLSERTFDTAVATLSPELWKPGVGAIRGVLFAPHWDTADGWVPGATRFIADTLGPGETLVGIDEHTAMMGDGAEWRVIGRGAVHVLRDGAWGHHADGEGFRLDLRR